MYTLIRKINPHTDFVINLEGVKKIIFKISEIFHTHIHGIIPKMIIHF